MAGKSNDSNILGCGLDVGTMNLISARRTSRGVSTRKIRDVFLSLDKSAKKALRINKKGFIDREDDVIITGDAALEIANMFNKQVRRPLSGGLISASEADSLEILAILVKNVLGDPKEENEVCYFSVPAAPVDVSRDVIYHTGVFERIVSQCGYEPFPSNEAMAIIYAEAAADSFSGIGISMGCLTPDTPIITREGLIPIGDINEGDFVLTRKGKFHRVLKTWEKDHDDDIYKISFMGNPMGVSLTDNHKVWVQRDNWVWVPACSLKEGDIIGEPIVSGRGQRKFMSLRHREGNGSKKSKVVEWSSSLGRFLGYFLSDGHLGPDGRYTVWFDFGPDELEYVEDIKTLADRLFSRSVCVVSHGKAKRCEMSHNGLYRWLKKHCFDPNGDKRFPLNVEDLNPSVVENIVVGLVRGDGWVDGNGVHFGNSSLSLITACHLLLGKMGMPSTITRRDPRDRVMEGGREVKAEDCKHEWGVHVCGLSGEHLKDIIKTGGNTRSPKVWVDGGFRCTKIRSIEVVPYNGNVIDLTIEGDPSFCAPYITLHNSGMTNVALAMNALEGMTFSISRGGDWIDSGVAGSIGGSPSRVCAIKERGVDIRNPKTREEEAIGYYYKSLINYVLKNIANQFKMNCQMAIPRSIPIIVGGGTSLATGLMDVFTEVFEKKHKKRFPLEISDIRHASTPLETVAHGLLVQAMQEYDED